MTEVPQEVQREIQILSENDHPFLMQMAGSLMLRVEGCMCKDLRASVNQKVAVVR